MPSDHIDSFKEIIIHDNSSMILSEIAKRLRYLTQ